MPVRLRITVLFVVLVTIILGVVCGGIYYFSYSERRSSMKIRLTNRAITTGRLLAQKEIFTKQLIQQIDSLTTLALKNKTVQAYNGSNRKVYSYSDIPGDSIGIDEAILEKARQSGKHFFMFKQKEAVAYHYVSGMNDIIIISAAEDVDGKEALRNLLNILLVSFLAGIAFVLIAGYIFSTGLLLPIKKITADVEEISAQNLTRRIKTGQTKDEWFQLASTLNQLLDRLQESFDLQRRFISNASHELSTPLTSISSQIEVSLQREREAKEYKEVMQSIYQDVQHMSKLFQTLLEFAKASGNTGGLEINLIRIDEIILRLPSEIMKANPQYNVRIEFEKLPESEEALLVFGNDILLFSAIKNIALNACKYSLDNEAVVKLEAESNNLSVTIIDKGKGIPEAELKKIFHPFYRVEEISGEGFGLGLSLADRIIKLHKGTIQVESEINKGSRFIINLPAARSLK